MEEEEFLHLLSNLNGETPLGQIVNIRAEKDKETLKHFTAQQKKIREDWKKEHFKEVNTSLGDSILSSFLKSKRLGKI